MYCVGAATKDAVRKCVNPSAYDWSTFFQLTIQQFGSILGGSIHFFTTGLSVCCFKVMSCASIG